MQQTQALDTQVVGLYPDRLGIEPDSDHEAAMGDCVRISGFTAWVEGVEVAPPGPFDDEPIVRVTVRIQNRDDDAQLFSYFDWGLQDSTGVVASTAFDSDAPNPLEQADLVSGGEVTGTVSFEAGPGTYYVIWEPDLFDDGRGVWQVTVP